MSSNLGDKVRGAAHVVHGIGDNIRGTTLGTADALTNSKEGETRNGTLALGGREETSKGMGMLRTTKPHSATSGTETQTAPAPEPSHNTTQ
ncbi:hypothetical protein VKT23_015557 [Stygiomarasmius scandens]|uniref:CsbD-like domain-containing protein n=1 Tax=Marasmiellus scandens TaxID=2682957 RepID=A0ABR1J052_9AGAR